MEISEVVAALDGLPGIRAVQTEGRVSVYLPAIDDTVRIDAAEVMRHRRIRAPNGDPAVEFVMGDGQEAWPLIVTPDDVIYQPADTRAVLDSPIHYQINNAPHIVAYTEMEKTAERVTLDCERAGPTINLDSLGASLLLMRCFIVAATLTGLRPVRSVAWWQRAWDALGGDVFLPPFRADPLWDELTDEASRITVTATLEPAGVQAQAAARVTVDDFRRLEPALTAVGLDEEFVSCWRASVPVTPARFAETLLERLDSARADVALYPGGGGSADVTLRDGDAVALLQFSWSSKDELHIDEVRIPDSLGHGGLFQRMMFNAERLAAMLGFRQVTILASGVGGYAFAVLGNYPRDMELYKAMRKRPR